MLLREERLYLAACRSDLLFLCSEWLILLSIGARGCARAGCEKSWVVWLGRSAKLAIFKGVPLQAACGAMRHALASASLYNQASGCARCHGAQTHANFFAVCLMKN